MLHLFVSYFVGFALGVVVRYQLEEENVYFQTEEISDLTKQFDVNEIDITYVKM
jgi:hypothetical protein